jgi:hypothetical protein
MRVTCFASCSVERESVSDSHVRMHTALPGQVPKPKTRQVCSNFHFYTHSPGGEGRSNKQCSWYVPNIVPFFFSHGLEKMNMGILVEGVQEISDVTVSMNNSNCHFLMA